MYKQPTRSAGFSDAENYAAAIVEAGELQFCHILVTKPYLKAVIAQVKNAPRVKNSNRVMIRTHRGVQMLANIFGPEATEMVVVSTKRSNPSGFCV